MNFLSFPEQTKPLLTWLDVERFLKRQTALWTKLPAGIEAVQCFSDGMEVRHADTIPLATIHGWLSQLFGAAYDQTQSAIRLRIGPTPYPVSFEAVSPHPTSASARVTYPLWREVAYLSAPSSDATPNDEAPLFKPPPQWSDDKGPQVVSFHSFKGGVGRTTALMTYVTALLEQDQTNVSRPLKILVVDADLEAPGITFWLEPKNQPQVSFVQFLEAMHFPPSSESDSLAFFAQSLRKTSLTLRGGQRELFVLPATLALTDIEDMPVQPSHLAKNLHNPWILTDHLYALGRELGVDAVFVDLRAGLSELSSPLLFDPRVEHFFVTTIAKQSVLGMAEVLKRLHTFNRCVADATTFTFPQLKPTVVLSMVTDTLRKSDDYSEALRRLEEAYPTVGDDNTLLSGFEWAEVMFSEQLMSVGSLEQAVSLCKQSSLFDDAQEWAKASQPPPSTPPHKPSHDRKQHARRLHEVCERIQFAEKQLSSEMLVTEPLRNIGKHFSGELPNLVSVGAKGAGKTFTFLQLCQAASWHSFLKKVDVSPVGDADALIFPCLWSLNLDTEPKRKIQDMRASVLQKLQLTDRPPSSLEKLHGDIKAALRTPPDNWGDFWNAFICQQFGKTDQTIEQLSNTLRENKQSVIWVLDGLEDVFDEPTHPDAQAAIHSLLQLPNRLSDVSQGCIGVLIFVRADYVQSAIKQNTAQFLSRYAPFQLHWNPESFLRLAYWIGAQANILENTASEAQTLSEATLLTHLERVWGSKMGSNKSKEAMSARWVFASLCDLKGNIQARDLVRFLKIASKLETDRSSDTYADRVLAPESMRKAIAGCSREKIEEAVLEIALLKQWKERLESITSSKQIPFDAKDMGLESKDLQALQELGVIFEDGKVPLGQPRCYLPEIYRIGLNFEMSNAGRPRTIALLKSNLGKLPF